MLGYEGYIKIGGDWVLGTGSSVPKERPRIDSASGYGGTIAGSGTIGIGMPHMYDWTAWDGKVDFDLTKAVFDTLMAWTKARSTTKEILFSSRSSNEQKFDTAYWTNISISASEGAMTSGTLGFLAENRTTYTYGTDTISQNGTTDAAVMALEPIPYWFTAIGSYKFIEWSLDFSQSVVKFFSCQNKAGPQGPAHIGIGPMTISLTGSYIQGGGEFADTVASLVVTVAGSTVTLKNVQLQNISDDVRTRNTLTPISMDAAVYELG